MSLPAPSPVLKRSASAVAMLTTAMLLAGCSTMGFGGSDGTVTGATGDAARPTWGQAMPGVAMAPDSRFIPPANIGNAPGLIDPNTAMPVGAQTAAVPSASGQVTSQDLPALSSPSVTSNEMPAQAAAVPASTLTPPATSTAPQLGVVTGDTYRHTIASGESLYTIARRYDVSAADVIAANGISSPDRIVVGQQLIIPGRADLLAERGQQTQVAAVNPGGTQPLTAPTPVPAPANTNPQPAPAASQPQQTTPAQTQPQQVAAAPATQPSPTPAATTVSDRFRWPISGRVITDFAASGGTGINIEAAEGTSIRAAEAGEVIYVGNAVEGYGNLVLIRHSNGYVSAYAHLRDISVQRGAQVGRGDAIGTVGMTGSVTRPQLHFELRRGATPVDPAPLLAG